MLSRGGMRRHGARRLPARKRDRQVLYQRDQYDPGLHFHQHVSQDVGELRTANAEAARSADRARAGTRRDQEKTAVFTVILPFLFLFQALPSTDDLEATLKKLTQVLSIVQQQAADPVSTENAIYQGAIPGMLQRLDPHSVFFDPGQFEQLKQMERS